MAADSKPKNATIFSGRLTIYAADNFEDRISQARYVLELDESGQMVPLNLSATTDISDLRSGMQVEVLGRQQNGYIDVERFDILSASSD